VRAKKGDNVKMKKQSVAKNDVPACLV
jgi:hypothetical protein